MRRAHVMPFGTSVEERGVRFRLWAPDCADVLLHIPGNPDQPMTRTDGGWAEAFASGAGAGTRYGFRVGGRVVPDPAARSQPDDVHGLSRVVDPLDYVWRDGDWRGRPWHQAVLYEMHVGSFTPQGTFAAARGRLHELAELGITALSLMPVADFPGRWGWGYDGVLPFAPDASYGPPEDFKALVDEAHGLGLMVLLDVVYNHFGPEGNYLHATARRFLTHRHHTPWGQAVNFGCAEVRDFFIHNALYWLTEYHLDGLRLDAVHTIRDDSTPHVLEELARRARALCGGRPVHLVLENDANGARLLGQGLYSAQWNDDFHHSLHRLLTAEDGGYYRDYAPDPLDHLLRCLTQGFAFQGEESEHRDGAPRGEPSGHLPPTSFVAFLQNHDHVGNRALGERIDVLAPPQAVRAATALLLLCPQVPLLFQGEEWGAATPFLYFCDLGADFAQRVRDGRRHEFVHDPRFHGEDALAVPDPLAAECFARSRLDRRECREPAHAERLALVRTLLDIRRREVMPRLDGARALGGERLGAGGLRVEWQLADGAVLTLAANLSDTDLPGAVCAEGRLLYSTGGEGGCLSAWTVSWYLDHRGEVHERG